MSLTPTEESQTRALIAQEAALLSLAGNEPTITSKLGAQKVNLSQLQAASSLNDSDLLLVRQGTTDKSVQVGVAAFASKLGVQQGAYNTSVAGGTSDAITTTFTPAITAFSNGPIFWRATAANTTTTPTLKRDGLSAKTIVKGNNLPLSAGDIPGAGDWMCSVYDATLDREVLLNPATGQTTQTITNDATFADNSQKPASTGWLKSGFAILLAANGYIKLPSWLGGLILQWGSGTTNTGTASVTFPLTFPSNIFCAITNPDGLFSGTAVEVSQWSSLTNSGMTIQASSNPTAGGTWTPVTGMVVRWIALGN